MTPNLKTLIVNTLLNLVQNIQTLLAELMTTNVVLQPRIYRATLTQTGAAAPVAIIQENTLGNIVWSRSGVGLYSASLTGAFPPTNTLITCEPVFPFAGEVGIFKVTGKSSGSVSFVTQDVKVTAVSSVTATDGMLTNTSIIILAYL